MINKESKRTLLNIIMKNLLISLFVLICLSCCNDDEEIILSSKTVLVYMAADNNLYRNAKSDIQEMLDCKIPDNCNLLVYLDAPSWSDEEIPQLFKIQSGQLILVKQYESHNSASKEVLRQAINDVIINFEAETYDLILWSHGTGWLPENVYETLTKSFGKDDYSEINIIDLANALPVKFGCIIFDACLMGGIEVYYQLRNKADIIIASPTETLVAGLPYNKILPFLFVSTPDYAGIAREYMDYYKNQAGILQSATIGVVETKHLEVLAGLLNSVVTAGDVCNIPDKELIQKYDLLATPVFYDFLDYIRNVTAANDITAIEQQLSKVVIYNDFTPYFLNDIEIIHSCGISIYGSYGNGQLDEVYQQLDWYIDSRFGL
jgi:hypothetical protein